MVDVKVERFEDVVTARGSLDKACIRLKIKIATGVAYRRPDNKTIRFSGKLGVTIPMMAGIKVDRRTLVGSPKKEHRYQCSFSGKYFKTKAECEKSCKPKKPPKNPERGNVGHYLSRGHGPSCTKETTIVATYRVFRTYSFTIYRLVLQWHPEVDTMPSALRIVEAWNKKIVDHEEGHVDDIVRAVNAMLPDEMTYVARGEDDAAVESDLENQIQEDNQGFYRLVERKITRDKERYHTVYGEDLASPKFCG